MRVALTVAGAAVVALLAAGCGFLGLSGSGGGGSSAALSTYGSGAYRLMAHTGGYSAEVIAKQVPGGIAVLAVGGAFHKRSHLCAPGLSFVFNENGGRLTWTLPTRSGCTAKYAFSDFLVCVSSSHIPAGVMPKTDSVAGCNHPVLPADTGISTSLTAKSQAAGQRYLVNSAGIILLPRSKAISSQ